MVNPLSLYSTQTWKALIEGIKEWVDTKENLKELFK
jgi:hypothetical protein